ncbi:hypothetical protein BASA81_016556 [Batrachochytrium salamandrivorans]|nr:hypothetical protein BASA81_016556 [Batrachochytrium salamandrivorans]
MEGSLLKRTTNNAWHTRKFKLERNTLSWLKSDNVTEVVVDLSKNCTLRDVKFGPKKFAFDVCLPRNPNGSPGEIISLSASGEAEKAAWMSALSTAMGKKKEGEAIFTNSVASRKSVRNSKVPVMAKPTPAPLATASKPTPVVTVPTPLAKGGLVDMVTQASATNNKLGAKIGGRVMVSTQTLCAVCNTPVYKMEELIVDKAVMHKKCFQCNHCKRQLTMGNFACINSTFYCKVHYFELFSQSGGKYEKAFGDAGFAHKAQTSYTPPTAASKAPGSVPSKETPPPAAAVTAPSVPVEKPVAKVEVLNKTVDTPNKTTDTPSKTLEVSKKSVEAPTITPQEIPSSKPKLEVLPKKNMDELRKMVRLPGMGGPPLPSPVTRSAVETEKEEVAIKEELHIRPPPMGVNFALEAVKKRQAQLGITPDSVSLLPSSNEDVFGNGGVMRGSVRGSTRLDHTAALSKPKMTRRRAPKIQEVGKALAKSAEVDKMEDDCTFKILLGGLQSAPESTLIVHSTSLFERDHWVSTLNANIHAQMLKNDLVNAQKVDMMSALQAQVNLETFMNDNETAYSGFLEKLSMKSQRNWKKRWFTLNDRGELNYYDSDVAKKPKQMLAVTYLTVLTSMQGQRLDAPLVINLAQVHHDPAVISGQTENALPMNFAIFDNEEATVDLSAVFNEQGEQVAIPQESLAQDEELALAAVEEEESKPLARTTLVGRMMRVSVREEGKLDFVSSKRASQAAVVTIEKREEEEEESTPAPRINMAWGQPGKAPDRPASGRSLNGITSLPAASPAKKLKFPFFKS